MATAPASSPHKARTGAGGYVLGLAIACAFAGAAILWPLPMIALACLAMIGAVIAFAR